MKTIRKKILMILFLISCSLHAIAQADYYYCNGRKISLILNENKVAVNIPTNCPETSKRIYENVQPIDTIRYDEFDVFFITRSDYEKLTAMDTWEEDAKSVILTLGYSITEEGEVFYASPYINVKLKKEQDIDLLSSYADKYKFRIVGDSPFSPLMPLWYILAITPESEKNPVECANELYETGNFADSLPEFMDTGDLFDDDDNTTSIQSIAQPTTEDGALYDLSGRKISAEANSSFFTLHSSLKRGIYIEGGKKKVK